MVWGNEGAERVFIKWGGEISKKKEKFERRFEKIWKEIERKVSFLNKIWE